MFTPVPKRLVIAIATALISIPLYANEEADSVVEGTASDLEIMVVSGTRTKKALKDIAGSISVVSQQDIEKQSITDMNQLFKYDPSVQVTGNVGEAQNFIVRGMGGDRVLMIKDGMRMNEGYGADGLNDIVGRGFIETDTLKQVEVAKGASSSLYGSDALGGIVVFTTKDASDYLAPGATFGGEVKSGFSSNSDQYNIGGALAFVSDKFEGLVNLTYRDGEEQQNYLETKSPFDIDSTSVLLKAKYHVDEKSFLTFSVDSWQQKTVGESANGLLFYFRGLAPYGYNIVTENSEGDKDNRSLNIGFESKAKNALFDTLNVNTYWHKTEQQDKEYGQLDINAPMFGVVELRDMYKTATYQQDTYGIVSNATLQIGSKHTLGYGIDIETSESQRFENKLYSVAGVAKPGYPEITDKFPRTDTFKAGLFVNDEISLMDNKLIITPGLRFDMYKMDPNNIVKSDGSEFKEFDENHTSLNLGGLYKINDSISLFAQYGQGFKVPAYDLAYIEHYNQASSTYLYQIIPSEDLSPEESDSYEIGIRGQLDNLSFSAAIYQNDYDNFLTTNLVSSEQVVDDGGSFQYQHDIFQYQNLAAVKIKGAEIGFTYHTGENVSLFGNASYQDGKDQISGEYITSISPLSGVFGVSFDNDVISTELLANWSKAMSKVNQGNYQTPGYVSLDWLLKYSVNQDIKFNLSVNNLLDKQYLDYGNAAGHAQDSNLDNLLAAGRNFSARVHYSF